MTALFSAATGWLLYCALTLVTGSVAIRWIVLPRVGRPSGPEPEWYLARSAAAGRWGAAALLLALALFFVRQLLEFRDPFVPWQEDAELLLTATPWGRTWLLGAAGAGAATVAFLFAGRGRRWAWWLATPLVLALGAFPAFTGHAAGQESLRTLALAADTLHVLGAGGWIGGLAIVLLLEGWWRRRSGQDPPVDAPASLLPVLVPVFSPLAIVCVGTLVVTGLFTSWLHLDGLGALTSTRYGRILLGKLLLVAAVLGMGALNWRRLTPRLGEPGGTETLRRAAATEWVVAQAVLLVTAILVRTAPM